MLELILFRLPGILLGFSMHEFGHALAAHKLGDPTPERDGRLTISPRSHIDPLGLLLIAIIGFGWARPVRINPTYFKNPKRDHLLVAIAGPLMNLFVLAFFILLMRLTLIFGGNFLPPNTRAIAIQVFAASAFINGILIFFNLLPIGPLDGFTVLSGLLPYRYYDKISFLQTYGSIILMILIIGYQFPVIGLIFRLLVVVPANNVMIWVSWLISLIL
jgi:Zn-dependent protease